MTELRRPKGALSLGDAVPILGHATHAPPRYCTRCGARLSHYNKDYNQALCAPCDQVLHPWQPPTRYGKGRDVCPSCGGLKKQESRRCRRCANQGVRLDFTGHQPL